MNRNRLNDVLAGYELARRESESDKPQSKRGCSAGCFPWWILPLLCSLCAIAEMVYRAQQGFFK